ncbi:MAG: thioredoxin domain-containing protein, partial [Deltaproteobacteria bacterium]|nr:thioredoxin domain-containing protein [Deltaproteobacteria bacterium]
MSEIDGIERLSRYLAGEMSEAEAKAIAEALSTQRDMGVALERLRALDRLVAEVASEVRRPAADPVIARAIARGEPRRVDLRRWLPVAVAVAVLVTMTIVLRPESAPPAPTAVLTGQAAEIAPGSIVDDPRTVGELPIVDAGSPARGAADAPLTIVEFADFECPFCRRAEQPLTELGAAYEGRVRLVFKHFPMPFHPYAHAASRAAIAAHVQGRFWDYAARLFAEKRALDDVLLITHAQALGLDVVLFRSDIASAGTQAQLDADVAEGKRLGVEGVPTFFINGRKVTGARTKEEFKAIIDEELA